MAKDFDALAQSFKELGKVADAETKAAAKEAADVVAGRAKGIVPHMRGKLGASIGTSGTKRGGKVFAGGPRAVHGAPIHWGWSAHNIKRNAFLYKALDSSDQKILDIINGGVDDAIAEVF